MGTTSPLAQTPNWAKREPPKRRPPTKPRKDPLVRDYLTPQEVNAMVAAAKKAGGRTADRDALLVLLAYRHGLRASELTALRWDQVDLKAGLLHVARLKHGDPSTHCAGRSCGQFERGSARRAGVHPMSSPPCAAGQ